MSIKRFFSLLVLVFGLFFQVNFSFAQNEEKNATNAAVPADGEKKGINITEIVFGHVSDSHEWHFFGWTNAEGKESAIAIPLPMIIYQEGKGMAIMSSSHFEEWHKTADGTQVSNSYEGLHLEKKIKEKVIADDGTKIYDFSVTKSVLCMMIGFVLLIWAMSVAAKNYKYGPMHAPKGFQNFIEVVIIFIRDEVGVPNLGPKTARFMPLLLTIFFFIWINNLLGLLPFGLNFTGNITVTAFLALVAFIVMMANSNKHFWAHLLNPPNVPFLVKILLIIIEIMSLFIKPVALMIRLFANMLAGHIVILSVICMIFIFAALNKVVGGVFVPVSLAFSLFMFLLELLVAAIQAFIFTNLTAVFLGQVMEGDHEGDTGHAHEHTEKEIVM